MVRPVSEYEVLVATIDWLQANAWSIERVSPAPSQGLPPEKQRALIQQRLGSAGRARDAESLFQPGGPDIVARLGDVVWKIECKGITAEVHPTTDKNKLDRAVASVVSYYDSPGTRLGIALASDHLFSYDRRSRLPAALRSAINLWVFIVDGEAYPIEPADDLPYPGAV